MTTAVLAGLTLGNVNATEAHAATVSDAPVTSVAAQKQTVSQSTYNSQSNVVAKDAQDVADQQIRYNNASDALASAQNASAGAKAVASASDAYTSAANRRNEASAAAEKAYGEWVSASDAVEHADTTNVEGQTKTLKWFHDQWVKSGSAQYAKDQQKLADLQNDVPAASDAVKQASDALKASMKAGSDANVKSENAQRALTAAKNMPQSTQAESEARQDAMNQAQADIDAANALITHYRALNATNY